MILVLLADQNVVGLTAANLAFYILQRGASVPLPMQAGTHDGFTGGERHSTVKEAKRPAMIY